jgi:hypothetical protein
LLRSLSALSIEWIERLMVNFVQIVRASSPRLITFSPWRPVCLFCINHYTTSSTGVILRLRKLAVSYDVPQCDRVLPVTVETLE